MRQTGLWVLFWRFIFEFCGERLETVGDALNSDFAHAAHFLSLWGLWHPREFINLFPSGISLMHFLFLAMNRNGPIVAL